MGNFTKRKYLLSGIITFGIVIMVSFMVYAETYTKGDVNSDGKINLQDAIKVVRHIAATKIAGNEIWLLDTNGKQQADIDSNNDIDVTDVLDILRYIDAENDESVKQKHPEWVEKLGQSGETEPDQPDNPEDPEDPEDPEEPENPEEPVKPTSISLNKSDIILRFGEKTEEQLIAKFEPEGSGQDIQLTWESSDMDVAIVTNNGLVTAIGPGYATIKVSTPDGLQAMCTVNVFGEVDTEIYPVSISLNKPDLKLNKGQKEKLEVIYDPKESNAGTDVEWRSTDNSVVTVSQDGEIEGISGGTARIIAETEYGKSAECVVTVEDNEIQIEGISLNEQEITLDINAVKEMQLEAEVIPEEVNYDGQFYWSSSNVNVAKVDQNGLVKAVSDGEAIITVSITEGFIAECKVTVKTTPMRVELDKKYINLDMSTGRTAKIEAKVMSDEGEVIQDIFWSTTDPDVAVISADGNVLAIGNGTCEMVATAESGVSARCEVTVNTSPVQIYFEENKDDETKYLSLNKGSMLTLKPVIVPDTANINNEITYSLTSGNEKVISINNTKGTITGNQAGVVTIQAKTANNKTATINVNVKIGNSYFDTTKLKDESYTNSSLIYSKGIDIGAGFTPQISSHMQSFDIDANNKIYYASNGDGTKKDLYITEAEPNTISNDYMKLTYAGHGNAIDIEEVGNEKYIWANGITSEYSTHGYSLNYVISRVKYENGSGYNFAAGTVKVKNTEGDLLETYNNPEGDNFMYISVNGNMLRNAHPAVDEENRLLAVYYSKRVWIYDLDEALAIPDQTYTQTVQTEDGDRVIEFQAKNLNSIEKLTTITVESGTDLENDILSYSMQGFDIDGDYVYIGEGYLYTENGVEKTASKAYVTVFDYMYNYNGNVPKLEKTEIVAINNETEESKELLSLIGDTNKAELEGIKVKIVSGKPTMYLGFMSNFGGTKSANIFKYTY